MNLGSGRFANISAVSGFAFPDDARGLALVDWDFDGDLDAWLVNRSGPQVRFVRNDWPSGNAFLALSLSGKTCNRDAIGARVEVHLRGDSKAPLIKTLRAGEGFLSQSSKWVHFGLGANSQIDKLIDKVVVRWPGREAEEFRGLEANRRYQLVQGTGRPQPWQPAADLDAHAALPAEELLETSPETPKRSFLGKRFPLPRLPYTTFTGDQAEVRQKTQRPVLLVLWASWCAPCAEEFKQLQDKISELTSAGVEVVALCVNGLAADSTGVQEAEEFARRFNLPATFGMATVELIDRLQLYMDTLFGRDLPLAVPYSFLLDERGELAAVYRGPMDVSQVAADAKNLSLQGAALRNAGVPFHGTWVNMPDRDFVLRIARRLVDEGFDKEGQFAAANKERMRPDPDYARFLEYLADKQIMRQEFDQAEKWCREALQANPESAVAHHLLGLALYGDNRPQEAVASFRRAVELSPSYVAALKNLTWIIATSEDKKVRNGPEAVEWAKKLFQAARAPDPILYDVAAAAYASAGRFDDAVRVIEGGITLARKANILQLAAFLEARREQYRQRQPLIEKAGLPEFAVSR